jgi:hypothetical protein
MTPETLALLVAYIDAAIDARAVRYSCGPHVRPITLARADALAALMAHVKDAAK